MTTFEITPELTAVLHRFRTAELTTIGKDGTPATWPVTVVYREDLGEFLTSTSIGFPQKAVNIERNPRVSMLFSEARASGLSNPPAVLVQGDAVAGPMTALEGVEDVWEKVYRFQPAAKWSTWGPMQWAMGRWYCARIPIRIVPTRILWWPNADFALQPQEVSRVG